MRIETLIENQKKIAEKRFKKFQDRQTKNADGKQIMRY